MIVTNAQRDPTRTAGLRQAYAKACRSRFVVIKSLIRETVVTNEALSSTASIARGGVKALARAATRYDFPSDPAGKAQAFMDWLMDAADEGILEIEQRDGRRIVLRQEWQNVYVRSAYTRGVEQADKLLARAGGESGAFEAWRVFDQPSMIDPQRFLRKPMHADALGILYTRNFNDLKGITEAMGNQIAEVLTRGMAQGMGMRQLARLLNERVDKIGIRRATTMARTEIIRAHAEATINRYEEYGLQNVVGMAEWQTAGDHRVCPLCRAIEGRTYTIAEARGMLPLHPNCRCTWLPVLVDDLATNRRIFSWLWRVGPRDFQPVVSQLA
jgi:SPP1 gp7 family putative phage head morphogenesis protein